MARHACVVDEIISNKNCEKPLLVSFANGQIRPAESEIQFKLYKQKNAEKSNKKGERLHLVAESGHTTFRDTDIHEDSQVKHCVGVLHKHTGKLKIYETETFYMESHIESEGKKDAEEDNLVESILEKKDALTMSFGSKRKRRAVESRNKHAVKGEQLDVIMKKTAVDVEIVQPNTQNGDLQGFIDVNWEAKRLNDVYNLDEIISEWELHCLGDLANEFAETDASCIDTWRDGTTYQPFIINRLEKLQGSKRMDLIKLLLYLHYLVQFCELKAADVRKRDPLPDEIPYTIRQKIVEKYTKSSVNAKNVVSRAMTPEVKDKLVAHIIVLGLTLNDYKIDMHDIKSIKFSRERLGLIGRMIGARLSGNKSSKSLELKLPLTKFSGIVGKKGRK